MIILPEEGLGGIVSSSAIAAGRKRPKPRSAAASDMISALDGVRNLLKRNQTLIISVLERTIRGLRRRIRMDNSEFASIFPVQQTINNVPSWM